MFCFPHGDFQNKISPKNHKHEIKVVCVLKKLRILLRIQLASSWEDEDKNTQEDLPSPNSLVVLRASTIVGLNVAMRGF